MDTNLAESRLETAGLAEKVSAFSDDHHQHRQTSVLDTPPVSNCIESPAFAANYNTNASYLMGSGQFSELPLFLESTINETSSLANVFSPIFSFCDDPSATAALNGDLGSSLDQVLVSQSPPPLPTNVVAADMSVQSSFEDNQSSSTNLINNHVILQQTAEDGVVINKELELEPESDSTMTACVGALTHDHTYTPNAENNEDYQILRDFLDFGSRIGVVGDMDQAELDLIISSVDVGQLAPTTSYLDTYGDLTAILNEDDDKSSSSEPYLEELQQRLAPPIYPSLPADPSDFVSPSVSPIESPESTFSWLPSTSYASTPEPRSSSTATNAAPITQKDPKYWERRKKNNVASARSRQTRKQRAAETERERQRLEFINRQLKQEIVQLTRQVSEHKRRFFSVFKK